ncbi:MAG: GDSL-type esterase/lipase family protein [Candidatus Binatia bacterium]
MLLEDLNGDGLVKIVAFGDSITLGTGDNEDDARGAPDFGGYPARLQQALALEAANIVLFDAGLGGEGAGAGSRRIPSVLAAQQPDFVILLEGANNVNALDADGVPDAIDSMINSAFSAGAMPLVGTLTPFCCDKGSSRASLARSVSAELRVLAQQRGTQLVDFHEAFAPGGQFDPGTGTIWNPEGLHPTPRGYDLMASTAGARLKVPPLCHGFPVTMYGTFGDDVLVGTPGPDVIHGLKGNDHISGLAGDDVICGSGGDDFVDGGDGNDYVNGGKGNDVVEGSSGVDDCKGGAGIDVFGSCATVKDK